MSSLPLGARSDANFDMAGESAIPDTRIVGVRSGGYLRLIKKAAEGKCESGLIATSLDIDPGERYFEIGSR